MKALIIGWDGATWAYIDPLLSQGELPNLAALIQQGGRAILSSTRPPYTNIAWPSMVTGLSPVHTGIFDAARPRPHSYTFVPTNITGHRGTPIWRWINRFGLRAGVLNVPMTYPALPFDGYMVTGFDSPHRSTQIAYPADLLTQWARQGHPYRILEEEAYLMAHQNPHRRRIALEPFLQRWEHLTAAQAEIVAWLWKQHPVDFFFVVFSITDSVNHRARSQEAIRRAYVAADRALGHILEATDYGETLVCLVSDHGSTPADRYIALNRLLADAGWLHFHPQLAPRFWNRLPGVLGRGASALWKRLSKTIRRVISWPFLLLDNRLAGGFDNIDWSRTAVFARTALGPLYLNDVGSWPEGIVTPGEKTRIKAQVRDYLMSQEDETGRPLFGQVLDGDELYPHAHPSDQPPDLLIEPARWRDHLITGYPTDPVVRPIPPEQEYGTHTPEGIVLLSGPGIRDACDLNRAKIVDVVPTVLTAMGLPMPAAVDGEVLHAVFETPVQVEYMESEPVEAISTTEAGSEEVLARLRSLGYLE